MSVLGLAAGMEKLVAGKWIAGPEIGDAIDESRRYNRHGVRTIINLLGESFREKEQVESSVEKYAELIDTIKRDRIVADIAMKPTLLGSRIGMGLAERNYAKLADVAKRKGIFVWLDMEEYDTVDGTIKLYRKRVGGGNTGICIQSYLRRSADDLRALGKCNATIRLVKGAYSSPPRTMFQGREETTRNYYVLMEYLFKHFKRFTIGTHDTEIIERARELNRKYRRDVTYAMLMGIRDRYAAELAKKEKVSVYVPFGPRWIPYSYRRLKEASNLKLIVRSLFG